MLNIPQDELTRVQNTTAQRRNIVCMLNYIYYANNILYSGLYAVLQPAILRKCCHLSFVHILRGYHIVALLLIIRTFRSPYHGGTHTVSAERECELQYTTWPEDLVPE